MIGSEKVREFKFRAKILELGARIQSAGILIPREIYPARKLIPLRYQFITLCEFDTLDKYPAGIYHVFANRNACNTTFYLIDIVLVGLRIYIWCTICF